MRQRRITPTLLGSELVFTTSRSGGPGGQNVNKVNSKVTLHFDVDNSAILTADEKLVIIQKLAQYLTRDNVLLLTAQQSRSQLDNKKTVLLKFERLLAKAFERKKARKATRPTKGSVQDRIKQKKVQGEKKKWRRKPGADLQ